MLKQLRNRRVLAEVNKTQKDVASEIGVSLSQFKRYESGNSTIPLQVAVKWAKALNLDFDTFRKLWAKDFYKEEK